MERNAELFFAVADAIEREPHRYDQGDWFDHWEPLSEMPPPACGTTACIAGWAIACGRHSGSLKAAATEWNEAVDQDYPEDEAAELLGLAPHDADRLFHSHWRPHDGLSVPDALRKVGEGAAVEDVSAP